MFWLLKHLYVVTFTLQQPTLRTIQKQAGAELCNLSTDHCKLLHLIFVFIVHLGRLDKLQGKAVTHFCEIEWWRTLMVECVTIF